MTLSEEDIKKIVKESVQRLSEEMMIRMPGQNNKDDEFLNGLNEKIEELNMRVRNINDSMQKLKQVFMAVDEQLTPVIGPVMEKNIYSSSNSIEIGIKLTKNNLEPLRNFLIKHKNDRSIVSEFGAYGAYEGMTFEDVINDPKMALEMADDLIQEEMSYLVDTVKPFNLETSVYPQSGEIDVTIITGFDFDTIDDFLANIITTI